MSSVRIQTGKTERIWFDARDAALLPVTGKTDLLISIWRESDGFFYDFADNTFRSAPWTTRQTPMTEFSPTLAPGQYYYDFVTSVITNPTGDDTYQAQVEQSPGTDVTDLPAFGEIKVGQYVDDIDTILDATLFVKYDGAIWIDTTGGAPGTVVGVNGTPDNPVNSIADATTLATATGIRNFKLLNASSITLTSAYSSYVFEGVGLVNVVDLGGQNVDNSTFRNLILQGVQGGILLCQMEFCFLLGVTSMQAFAYGCWLTGNNSLRAGTLNVMDQCKSAVAGNATPIITFSPGVTNFSMRHYSGGVQFNNMVAGHTVSYEADGQVVFDASCIGGAASLRGNMTITDNSGGAVALTRAAAVNIPDIDVTLSSVHGSGSWETGVLSAITRFVLPLDVEVDVPSVTVEAEIPSIDVDVLVE